MSATQTSKAAYIHVNGSQTRLIGLALLSRTRAGLRSSDSDIARITGLPESRVAARRNDLIFEPMFEDGYFWRPYLFQTPRFDRATGNHVQVWAMIIYREGGNALDGLRETNSLFNTML